MDSQSQPFNKNQRRKRKDPESRDYACKCGKSYLSYAAAYTHVKNKHDGDKQFLQTIAKPEREKLKRGRPKQRKIFSVTVEAEKLSMIQEAILLIYQSFRETGDINNSESKVVLQGNQQLHLEQLVKKYDELVEEFGDPGINIFFNHSKYGSNGLLISKFIQSLNKHFLQSIAVKVIWFVNYLIFNCTNINEIQQKEQNFYLNFEKMKKLQETEKVQELWRQNTMIPVYIENCFEKWAKSTWDMNTL